MFFQMFRNMFPERFLTQEHAGKEGTYDEMHASVFRGNTEYKRYNDRNTELHLFKFRYLSYMPDTRYEVFTGNEYKDEEAYNLCGQYG